jgi:hypothetical protein
LALDAFSFFYFFCVIQDMPFKTVDQLSDLSGGPSSSDYLIIHDGSDAKKVPISGFNTIEGGNNSIKIDGSKIEFKGHILPLSNADYDIGSAEYKIRHLFLSDNSLWIGDQHKVDVSDGKVKFKKRKASRMPKAVTDAGGDQAAAIASKNGASTLEELSLSDWVKYFKTLPNSSEKNISDLFPKEGQGGYDADDYEDVSHVGGAPKALVSNIASLPTIPSDGDLAVVTNGADGGGKVLAYYYLDGWYRSTDNSKISLGA